MQTDDLDDFYEAEDASSDPVDPTISREDKIFNNRYNTGDGLTDSEDYHFSKKISVSSAYSDSYLRDIYEYEEELEKNFILDEIFEFIYSDVQTSKIINAPTDPTQIKLKISKIHLNTIFTRIHEVFEKKVDLSSFYSPIYVLEVLSSITSVEYKKLFDMLDSELKELLILELNKKYLFLDGKPNKKRIN